MLRLAVLNHLLAQRADLRAELARHAGQAACLAVPPFRLAFAVTTDGLLCEPSEAPATTLLVYPSLLPRLALRDPAAEREIVVEGDGALAATVGRVLQALDWDAEADLARLIGDIAAHRLAQTARQTLGSPRVVARNLAESAVEYLQEEARLLATGPGVRHFLGEVDRLRDDAARLEKRLQRLEQAGRAQA
ncbi:ubiquinone biosynthesis accessory factor UbiJ [Chitinimonas koreensis]|uniref:ubiquinone biosynthesis accessory factor UbiJ n=1 Tax=Chitinimonas koreensis TaxID=356302 RepID=UPI00041DE244|nr:hypothetical protein [Chitinimonas koreensis]QNM96237.1 hypothetical protein H9L41_20915 [Chitinimonas koreensis]